MKDPLAPFRGNKDPLTPFRGNKDPLTPFRGNSSLSHGRGLGRGHLIYDLTIYNLRFMYYLVI